MLEGMVPLTSKGCQPWKAPRSAEDLSSSSPKMGALCGPILATHWNCPRALKLVST